MPQCSNRSRIEQNWGQLLCILKGNDVHTGLAVLETRWWDDGNHSVRGLFEAVCGITTSNPFSFRYDMFCDDNSLGKVVHPVCRDRNFHTLYLAAHGDDKAIQGSPGNDISRTKLRNILRNENINYTLTGLYFGSCLVCNEENASFLLDSEKGVNVNWIAGYSKSVDWVVSSSVDMMFFSFLLEERRKNKSRRKGKKNDREICMESASEMKKIMPTVFNELGFNIYYLDSGGGFAKIW